MTVNRLKEEAWIGKAGTLAAQLSRLEVVVLDELDYLPFSPSGGALPIVGQSPSAFQLRTARVAIDVAAH